MIFKDVWILIFIPVVLLCMFVINALFKQKGFLFTGENVIKKLRVSLRAKLSGMVYILRILAILLVVIAMARPLYYGKTRLKKEGIAIMLAVDCSSTMLAEDLQLSLEDIVFLNDKGVDYKDISRLKASLLVAEDFVEKRTDDMIGLVAFAANAFLACPLTFDHKWLVSALDRVEVGLIRDGTAIGSGILSCLHSLKDVKAKSRIIILLTDGINNYGQISPLTAAKSARALGVRIYTIGIASSQAVVLPVKDQLGREQKKKFIVELDEGTLQKIADLTGGEYFRAKSLKELRKSYAKIDKLERTELTEKGYERYKELYRLFLLGALVLLLLEIILSNTLLRKIP